MQKHYELDLFGRMAGYIRKQRDATKPLLQSIGGAIGMRASDINLYCFALPAICDCIALRYRYHNKLVLCCSPFILHCKSRNPVSLAWQGMFWRTFLVCEVSL